MSKDPSSRSDCASKKDQYRPSISVITTSPAVLDSHLRVTVTVRMDRPIGTYRIWKLQTKDLGRNAFGESFHQPSSVDMYTVERAVHAATDPTAEAV